MSRFNAGALLRLASTRALARRPALPSPASTTAAPSPVRFASGNPWVARKRELAQAEAQVQVVGSRNHAIPLRTVQLVGEDGKLGEPRPIGSVLRSVDLTTHALVCVSSEPPVVKIVNLEEERAGEREREARVKMTRRLAAEDKEIQIGWTAAEGDLNHKINIARSTLEKGDRVHLIFAMRANSSGGARTFMPDSRKVEIVAQFDNELKQVGKRWKEDQIEKGLWICHWAPQDSVASEAKRKVIVGEVEKKRVRDEKKEARRLKEEEKLRRAKERAAAKAPKL